MLRTPSLFRCLFLAAAMICVFAVSAPCADNSGRYIKFVGVDAKNINLEVDGRKVSIPLPDGYELMDKNDYPAQYKFLYNPERESLQIPLCALINSADHKRKKIDKSFIGFRTAFFEIDREYAPHRFTQEVFYNEMLHVKSLEREIEKDASNKQAKSFTSRYIHDDKKALAMVTIENKEFNSGPVLTYSTTDALVDNIVISFSFYVWAGSQSDMNGLILETQKYIAMLDK